MMSGLEVAMAHVAGPGVHTGRRRVTTHTLTHTEDKLGFTKKEDLLDTWRRS